MDLTLASAVGDMEWYSAALRRFSLAVAGIDPAAYADMEMPVLLIGILIAKLA